MDRPSDKSELERKNKHLPLRERVVFTSSGNRTRNYPTNPNNSAPHKEWTRQSRHLPADKELRTISTERTYYNNRLSISTEDYHERRNRILQELSLQKG